MEHAKVSDNPSLGENDTYRAIQNDGKIWLFREKYEDQPDYRYGHRILTAGSGVSTFHTSKNQWSSFHEIPPILSESESHKLDELIFTFAGSIFMLLFNRFEGLKIESLWKFDEQKVGWIKHSDIGSILEPPTGDNTFGSKLLLVTGGQSDTGPYFVSKVVTSENTSFLILRLEIGNQSKVDVINRIDDLHSVLPALDPLPFAAVFAKQKIYIAIAEHGCGYRWRTEDLIRFDLETKTLDSVQINSKNPVFGLMMAPENYYHNASNSWLFFGSLTKVGGFHLPASEKTPETQFYSISDLTTENLSWKQSDQVYVNPGRDDIYVPSNNEESVFVISRQHGTLKLPFGSFKEIKSKKEEL